MNVVRKDDTKTTKQITKSSGRNRFHCWYNRKKQKDNTMKGKSRNQMEFE